MISPDNERHEPFRDGSGQGVVLFDPAYGEALPEWFDPVFWGGAAQAVADGGRGSAWFIENAGQQWVLRHYLRGGLAAKLSRDRYFWAGEAAVRSVAEFHLLRRLRALGLPVPTPVAARYSRRAGMYRAALLIERIPEARPLSVLIAQPGQEALWQEVGRVLAAFHHAGLDHADLNATNVLVTRTGEVFLIDFDRGQMRGVDGPWRARNLARLQRSFEKIAGDAADAPWRAGWALLKSAYEQDITPA